MSKFVKCCERGGELVAQGLGEVLPRVVGGVLKATSLAGVGGFACLALGVGVIGGPKSLEHFDFGSVLALGFTYTAGTMMQEYSMSNTQARQIKHGNIAQKRSQDQIRNHFFKPTAF